MATLEKPRKKKTKQSVPSNASKIKEEPKLEPSKIIADNAVVEDPCCSENISDNNILENADISTSDNVIALKTTTSKVENVEIKCDTKISDLSTNISNLVLQKVSPPLVLTYPQLPNTETSEEIKIQTEIPKQKEFIKPYTQTQLSAFYNNQEIHASKLFIQQFIETELRGINAKKHPLYELITAYLKSKDKLKENSLELNQLKSDYKSCQNQLWIIGSANISGKSQCQDNCSVVGTHNYKTAKFQRNLLESLIRIQNKIKRLTNEVYTLHSYNCSVLKLTIENYLDTVLNRCKESLNLNTNSQVALLEHQVTDPAIEYALRELRLCISVLFYFQRQLHKDKSLISETRQWLSDTIAILLRVANWQDHMYLLNHVLRCPAGINTWAISYIQIPVAAYKNKSEDTSPFSNKYINHLVAVLSVILSPVDKRDAFLEQILTTLNEPNDVIAENLWVLVDSDGESDDDNSYGILSLKENDLVSLLNQIPLDDLFRIMLLIEQKDNQDIFNVSLLTEHHILRLFAFSTVLIQLINNGLNTYSTMRYNQFAKRLCRLMRHILQYVSDAWEAFKSTNLLQDKAMLNRLQVEFDAFFLRTTIYLFKTRTLGSWQFLAIAPFHVVSIKTLWNFFYMLHQEEIIENDFELIDKFTADIDFKEMLSETSLRQQFCERLCIMSAEQSYYLLNTFGNMIMARSIEDKEFIQFATLNLLQIGFANIESLESCRRCAVILLSNITGRYPNLISDILSLVKNNISELEQLQYLFSELPLYLWQPNEKDIDILSIWLLQNPINSIENFLARKILSNLNWDYDSNTCQLFLPLELHRKIAVLLLQAIDKLTPQMDTYTFLDGFKTQNTVENNFIKFVWMLMYQLRLHSIDRDTFNVKNIPELIRFDVIQRGVREKQPLACYCAIAMTDIGHLLPLICSEGLAQLDILTTGYKYDAVLISLYYIVPMFVDNSETLLMCTIFQKIIQNLLNADKTYYKMAKSIISVEFPGTILKHFGNLIELHIHNPKWYDLIIFWVKSLISIPSWNNNTNILYLLNIIVRAAFFIPEKYRTIENVFNELLEKATDKNNSSNSSLLSWVPLVGNSQSGGSSLLLQGPYGAPTEPWLSYFIISLEHQHVELKTGLWQELLKQLYSTTGKTNVDNSLKKAANVLKVPSYSSNGLCIYRWCQLALDTPLNHPLLPLIWQKFFFLYLARIPGPENHGSVGSKFFDGVVNTSFSKKLKKRLQESVEYYKNKIDEASSSSHSDDADGNTASTSNKRENNSINELDKRCLNIFKAYILWLEEPILMEATLYLPSLPPQYEPRYLSVILQQTMSPWVELINYEIIQESFIKSRNEWLNLCNRSQNKKYKPPLQKMGGDELKNPVDRILRRLTAYDKPISAPVIKQTANLIPIIRISNAESLSNTLQPYMQKLQQYAEIYSLQVSEHIALESQYKDLVSQLYSNFQTKITMKRTCKSTCAGAGVIAMTFCEARINESIQHQMQTNRNNFATLLTRSLQPPLLNMCINCASFEQTADLLQKQLINSLQQNDKQSEELIRKIGVEFFYYIFSCVNEDLKSFPPTHQMIHNCLEKLGNGFLLGIEKETIRLCKKILQEPTRSSLLTPHFIGNDLSTNIFLQLYQEICDKLENMPEITFALISKFDINNWLTKKSPRLADRSKFIQLVFQSLCKLGIKPTNQNTNIIALHEIYRQHLLSIFRFDFPNHYGEILVHILQYSGQQTLAVIVWLDIINVLSNPIIMQYPTGDNFNLKDSLRRNATNQKLLHQTELNETIALLARYFSNERLQFGLYGLYPKYRMYIEVICIFLGQTVHAYIVSTLNSYNGELADSLLSKYLWPKVIEAFAPWLIPYSIKECKDTATWIQQLTDDRAILLPWIQADINNAQKLFNMFIECILFINDTLPACNTLYCYLWQFYASHFAHSSIKEHILTVVHTCLSQISWERFWPSLTDLEIMLKVIDQYVPECHTFLGKIFLDINWNSWLTHLVQHTNNYQITSRVHHCLLHLLVKLSNEPSVRSNAKARKLLENASEFNTWYLLDITALENALDWYIMSCDPRVVFIDDNSGTVKQIDYAVFRLLRVVSYYDPIVNTEINDTAQIVKKRQCFMRAYIKLLINCSSRYKNLVTSNPQQFSVTLKSHLNFLEVIINSVPQDRRITESNILMQEFLMIINNASLCQISLDCIIEWLESQNLNSILLHSILQTSAIVINNVEALSLILEHAISSYFNDNYSLSDITPQWKNLIELLNFGPPKQQPLENTLINNGRLLTLYALLLKKIKCLEDDDKKGNEILLETVVHWLSQIKAIDVIEAKLPLLWCEIIRLSLKVCHFGNEEKAANCLRKFVHQHLLLIAENKTGSTGSSGWGRGLLGAIGLIKQGNVTPHCRFLCKCLAGYILAQLPDTKGNPATVRCFSGASGPVGQPGGNTECAKVLLKLDSTGNSTELKTYVEISLKKIQDPQNSLNNAEEFLFGLVNVFYTKQYLKISF